MTSHPANINPLELFERGLLFFNNDRHYEAHEAWEDLWRLTGGPLREFYQGLIQAAVGLHHLHRGNGVGAQGQFAKAIRHLSMFPSNPHSIDTAGLIRQLDQIQRSQSAAEVRIARLKNDECL